MIHNPLLIILDEPLSGLDPLGRAELKRAFKELQAEGKTVFFSSHIVSDVEEVCDQVVVIDEGRLIYQGEVDKILDEHSKNEYLIVAEKTANLGCEEYIVPEEKLHPELEALLRNGSKIEKVQKLRISLEEFVYQSRNKDAER